MQHQPLVTQRARGFSPAEISARVNERTIDEQREEAVALFQLREYMLGAPQYSLDDFVALDDRLLANFEALMMARAAGVELTRAALEFGGPGEIFCATVLSVAKCERELFDVALSLSSDTDSVHAVVAALSWLPFELCDAWLRELANSIDPLHVLVAVATHANHRRDQLGAARLEQLCWARDEPLRARALRAVGELNHRELTASLVRALASPDLRSQFAAAESTLRLAHPDRTCLELIWAQLVLAGKHAHTAALLAGRSLGLAAARSWYQTFRDLATHHHCAIELAGHIGDPALVDDLIAWMSEPELARQAGHALMLITGVDLSYMDLDGEPPEAADEDVDGDEVDIELDFRDELVWPDRAKVERWWAAQRQQFTDGVRLLCGAPITTATCWRLLRCANQPVRMAAAFELTRLEPTIPIFETRAPAGRQLREIEIHTRHGIHQ